MPNQYTADKYRAKTGPRTRTPFHTESFTRTSLLKAIITAEARGSTIYPQKFEERKISAPHRAAILKCAQLWKELDVFEDEVKRRKP